jgi:hypothetical protein
MPIDVATFLANLAESNRAAQLAERSGFVPASGLVCRSPCQPLSVRDRLKVVPIQLTGHLDVFPVGPSHVDFSERFPVHLGPVVPERCSNFCTTRAEIAHTTILSILWADYFLLLFQRYVGHCPR